MLRSIIESSRDEAKVQEEKTTKRGGATESKQVPQVVKEEQQQQQRPWTITELPGIKRQERGGQLWTGISVPLGVSSSWTLHVQLIVCIISDLESACGQRNEKFKHN